MKSIIDFFENSVIQYPNNTLIWEKTQGKYKSFTYLDIQKEVHTIAYALLDINIQHGDRIALLSEGRRLWLASELAILHIGAINVPLSTKLEGDADLAFRINHSQAEILITSATQLNKVRLIRNQLTHVKKVIVLDETEDLKDNEILLSKCLENGLRYSIHHPDMLAERKQQVKPETYANICYTSGTTADPKGIILSHRNYTANVEQAFSYISIPQHYKTLVVLPWDHAFAHTASLYSFMHKGASIAAVQVGKNQHETLKNFVTNMQEIKPEILMSVPALAKNFKKSIEKAIESKGQLAFRLFKSGLRFAYWYNQNGNDAGKGIKKLCTPLYAFYKILIFNKIKERFGGKLEYFIGGGALLDIELQRFFYAIGIPMFQGYGLSEASPIISANTPLFHKLGSSGKVVNHLEIRICNDEGEELPQGEKGEIVIRGENVMHGYWRNEAASAQAIKNKWLFTGDLGHLDDQGYLYVLGRYKSLLIGADGEKYSPEGIEEAIVDHCTFIDQIILHNNQNPYTSALTVANKEKIKTWLKHHHKTIDSEETIKEVLHLIMNEIDAFKKSTDPELAFPARWMPSTLILLKESFSEKNKLVNSTMKVVRPKVESYFSQEINYLYTPEAKTFVSKTNIDNLKHFLNNDD